MRKILRGVRFVIASAFRSAPRLAFFGLLLQPLGILVQTFSALWLKWIVDAVRRGDIGAVRGSAIGLAATAAAGTVFGATGWRLRTQLQERTAAWIDQRVLELSSSLRGLEHHERAEYHDRMEILARQNLGGSIIGIVGGIASLVRLATTALLLGSLHPALVLVPVFGIPSVLASAKAQRLNQTANEEAAPHWRRANHMYHLVISPSAAKELRVFGLDPVVLDRHRRERDEVCAISERGEWRGAAWRAGGWVIFALGYLGAIGLVAVRASRGQATIGDVMFAIMLTGQVNGVVSGLADATRRMMWSLRAAEHFLWLEDLLRAEKRGVGEPPDRLRDGIMLEDVTFRYPGTEVDVLSSVELHLPAGARVAIVGDNGAGKTTLVKLLCRFYEPTSGRITVDGRDLSDLDAERWRERLAGGFQDYSRFELLARESVGVGDVPRIEEETAVLAGLARAGAAEIPGVLPVGLGTQLGRTFDGGVDLSTGQWQKIALGRAMMREQPLLLVLDEPTASLDAKTEHLLFQRYADAARARAADGAITLLVSHRFSTVRGADLIVVVDGGSIREVGSHEELMELGGLYAELFTLQAAAYR